MTDAEALRRNMQAMFERVDAGWRNPVLYAEWLKAKNKHETMSKNASTRKKKKTLSVESLQLSTLLAELIVLNKPDFGELQNGGKERVIQRWAADIDKMIRLDLRTPESIKAVIIWSQKDGFWFKNILSGSKLRKQFDRLEMDIKKPNRVQQNKHAGIDAWLQETYHDKQ
jgi:hypothetical protein